MMAEAVADVRHGEGGGGGGKSSLRMQPSSLEDACVDVYLKFLEEEVVAYVGLTQSESRVLRGVASKMVKSLKDHLNSSMSGIASSVIRYVYTCLEQNSQNQVFFANLLPELKD